MVTATRELGEELWRAFVGKKPKDFRSKIPPIQLEAELQTMARGAAEALIQWNLYTGCTMAIKPTIAQKIVPSILRRKRKWSKILHNLRINPHP
jgi:hypothetical protein